MYRNFLGQAGIDTEFNCCMSSRDTQFWGILSECNLFWHKWDNKLPHVVKLRGLKWWNCSVVEQHSYTILCCRHAPSTLPDEVCEIFSGFWLMMVASPRAHQLQTTWDGSHWYCQVINVEMTVKRAMPENCLLQLCMDNWKSVTERKSSSCNRFWNHAWGRVKNVSSISPIASIQENN